MRSLLVFCARGCGAETLDTDGDRSLCADCFWNLCDCGETGFLRCCGRLRCWDCLRKHRREDLCADEEALAEAAADRIERVERDFGPDR